jgi:hypothetical protein
METKYPEVEELKKKYGKITTIEVPLDEDDETKIAVFHLKRPGREERNAIQKLSKGAVPERAVIAGYKSLWVGGDDVAILERSENYDALLSAEDALVRFLEVQKAVIKKIKEIPGLYRIG